jgi:hypothetical protein
MFFAVCNACLGAVCPNCCVILGVRSVGDASQYVSPDTSQSLLSCQASTLLNLVSEYFYCMFAVISILVTRRVQQIIKHKCIVITCNSLLTTYFASNFRQM